jgi:hypothetical protein
MLVHLCFELSTLYTIFLLILFTLRKNCLIPLTFRTACYDWAGLRTLITNQTIPPSWCPEAVILPQCSCINDNLNRTIVEVLDKCLYMQNAMKTMDAGFFEIAGDRSIFMASPTHYKSFDVCESIALIIFVLNLSFIIAKNKFKNNFPVYA